MSNRIIGSVALLGMCATAIWAGAGEIQRSRAKVAPTKEEAPRAVGLMPAGTLNPAPALPGRTPAAPLAAAPLDDGGVSAELSAGAEGGGPRATLNVPGDYATIQLAIAAASDGDTIAVAAGTYLEIGQIVIAKNLAIVGASANPANWPIIKPAQDTGGSGDARGWWLVNAGYTLTMQYLILDGDAGTRLTHTGIRSWGTVDVRDCVIRNNHYTPSSYDGRGIGPYAGTANVIQRVTFQNMRRIGVLVFGTGVYATIDQCTYTGKGAGDWLDYAFEMGGGGGATISNSAITACTGVALVDGSTSAGILITTYFDPGTTGTVLGSVLTGNTTAIAVGYEPGPPDTSTVVAHYNDLSGYASDALVSTDAAVNAEKNWWGTTNAATIATLVAGPVDYTPFLLNNQIRMAFGGNRLADTQNPDGGWGWPLSGASAVNTVGPIATGLAKAYRATSDPDIYAALLDAGTFLLAKTNNFSPSDGYLAAELDAVLGGATYVAHLNTNFYGPLAAGTYNRNGLGTLYNTAGYVTLIRTARLSQGIPNLAAWDLGMGLVGAASCGVTGAELNTWIAGVEGEINELDGGGSYPNYAYYDVIGLAGALYGLAFVDEEFDPTAGEHAAADSLADLAAILASYQIAASGGFAWNSNWVIPYDSDETVQETGYAILALEEVGGYDTETSDAKDWLLSFQLGTGGWMNSVGSSENNEVTGEALWGIWASEPEKLTLEPDATCFTNPSLIKISVWVHDLTQVIQGGQFFMAYDNTVLDFLSADPAPTVFTNQVYETVNEATGTIDYATGVPFGDPANTTLYPDHIMAVLTFELEAPYTSLCDVSSLVWFRPHFPPTRLTTTLAPIVVWTVALDEITVDNIPPVISGCPSNITVNAAAGLCSAVVTWTAPTATDNCGSVTVVQTGGLPSGSTFLVGGPYPITYTATDGCGNFSTCTFTVTVLGFNDLVVTIELQGGIANATTRCIKFTFRDCPGGAPTVINRDVTFPASGGNSTGTATFTLTNGVDCSATAYDCVTVEDVLHTLQSQVAPTIVSGQYVVTCTGLDRLMQGDLYNDNLVDIVDFGVFIGQWGWTGGYSTPCVTPWPHADMNANGGIDVGDYGFITTNFLLVGDSACCAGPGPQQPPRTSITMAEALALGLPAWIDMNADGVFDLTDVQLFISGGGPDPTPADEADVNEENSEVAVL